MHIDPNSFEDNFSPLSSKISISYPGKETVGEPFPDCQIKILNPDANGMGEIITKHPNMFSGYYNNKKALKESIKNGWMYTGDAGFIDNKNRLTVVDRVDDIATKSDCIKFSPEA